MEFMTCVAMPRSGHTFVAHNVRSWFPGIKYKNQEGILPSEARTKTFPPYSKKFKVQLIVVRDYLNWLASYTMYLQRKLNFEDSFPLIKDRVFKYRKILDEWVSPKYLLDNMRINYNEFATSKVYREDICYMLGGKYSEEFLNIVPRKGNWSSFDDDRYQDMGTEMNIGGRYKELKDNRYYKYFVKNDLGSIELWDYNIGFSTEQKEYLKDVGRI